MLGREVSINGSAFQSSETEPICQASASIQARRCSAHTAARRSPQARIRACSWADSPWSRWPARMSSRVVRWLACRHRFAPLASGSWGRCAPPLVVSRRHRRRFLRVPGHGKSHAAHVVSNPRHCVMNTSPLDHPWHFDTRGRTAGTSYTDHVRDMILQFLFTMTGERVNRPNFGAGLHAGVFEPNSTLTAAALEFSVRAGLQEWLGDVIDISTFSLRPRGGP